MHWAHLKASRKGSRLRRLKKEHGKEILKDDKYLNRRLPDKAINKFQNYFGIAILKNTHSLHAMKKVVGAVAYHCSESYVKENRHTYCPTKNRKKLEKNMRISLAYPYQCAIKFFQFFTDLSSDELLKCLHGKTQNNNEALNAFIWKRLRKDIFVGRNVMEIGICSAVMDIMVL